MNNKTRSVLEDLLKGKWIPFMYFWKYVLEIQHSKDVNGFTLEYLESMGFLVEKRTTWQYNAMLKLQSSEVLLKWLLDHDYPREAEILAELRVLRL